jgi:hypothetical protein
MRVRTLVAAAATAIVATLGLAPALPAQAATADRWGFAYVDNPTAPVWTVTDPARQYGSWKTAFPASFAESIALAPGRVLVRFPHIGAGARGNVHVTPVNRSGHYCEIVRWGQSGADELVDVQCHKPGGARDFTPFTVLWEFSSGVLPPGQGSFASVQYGTAAIVQAYNSTGGPVTVVGGGGTYGVRFAGVGLAGAAAGNLQVTAVQPNAGPRRCNVAAWAPVGPDIVARVFCYDQAGALVPTEFTASYHRERAVFGSLGPPKLFGYIWPDAPATPTNFNSVLGFGANTIGAIAPPGRYLVIYPQVGLRESHAQVVAYGATSNYCHLTQPWIYGPVDEARVDVICFDNFGRPTPNSLLATFTSRI